MILVDKTQEIVKMIFTLGEKTSDASEGYNLKLESPFTNETFNIVLPENTSAYTNRYDEFLVGSDLFNNMKEGQYYYSVTQIADGNLVESGLLEIKGSTQDQEYVSVETEETDDDILVYQG